MKVKFGAIVVAGSGKLGGHVFSRNRGGSYMRTKVTPLNPQSSRQTIVRALFAAISSAWSNLTAANRQSYEDKVGEYARTNIFGDLKNPSGKSLHQRLNQNLQNVGLSAQTTCPNPIALPPAVFIGAGYSVGGGAMNVNISGLAVGDKYIIFGTPSLSQGTTFVKNKLRQIGTFTHASGPPKDVAPEYEALFGIPAIGDNIHLKLIVINVNGQASPGSTVKANIIA